MAKEAAIQRLDDDVKIGLALSGGGYRASLFHLGALWRLNELGWLRRLHIITSVSGGSIVAAYLGARWSELDFDEKDEVARQFGGAVAKNFGTAFVKPMREMFATTIDIQTIGRGLLNPIGSVRGRVDGRRLADGTVGLFGEAADAIAGSTAKSIVTSLAKPWGALFGAGIDAAAASWDALNPFPTPSEALIKTYDRRLFHGKTLQDLPDPADNPEFCLYATNMQTGVSVRLTRDLLKDYSLGEVEKPDIPLARAVAASSGFPPFYCPVEVKVPLGRWRRGKDPKLWERTELRERMDLGDGAVYDNLGLTMLEENCETILVSDAGSPLDVLDALPFDWLSQALRTLTVAMDQSNKVRFGNLIEQFKRAKRVRGAYRRKAKVRGAYWGISNPIGVKLEKERMGKELLVDNAQTRALGEMRTRLNRFTDKEQENLINWGYALADARIRRRLIAPESDSPGTLPFPVRLQ